jgi:predicted Rossmann fold nucleotide-binding protein DprA/Smf involved in DNA uptake
MTADTWTKRRRARREQPAASDAAFALCARHLQAGALAPASRAALLAQRLMRLEAEQADRSRKRAIKEANQRRRAEEALEEARKAVASLEQKKPRFAPLGNEEWWALLQSTHRAAPERQAAIDTPPVRSAPGDSC